MLAHREIAPEIGGQPLPSPALLCFFKTDCPACHLGLRYLDGLFQHYRGRAAIVGVSQDDPSGTQALAESLGLELPMQFDSSLQASEAWGLEAVPALFLLDRPGPGLRQLTGIRQG